MTPVQRALLDDSPVYIDGECADGWPLVDVTPIDVGMTEDPTDRIVVVVDCSQPTEAFDAIAARFV